MLFVCLIKLVKYSFIVWIIIIVVVDIFIIIRIDIIVVIRIIGIDLFVVGIVKNIKNI